MQSAVTITSALPLADAPVFDYASRREKLRKSLRAHNLDAMLVLEPANRFYLSGFELHDSQPNESAGCLIVTAAGPDWLATDSRYAEAAARLWDKSRVFIYSAPVTRQLARLLSTCGRRIGVELAAITAAVKNGLERYGAPALLPADGLVERLRMIKDEAEIAALRKSFHLNHRLLAWLEAELPERLGALSERELAWEIEKYFREHGAQELAFSTIAAYGPNAALPHAIPGSARLRGPDCVLADLGCRVDDYCSDQTRTFWVGGPPPAHFTQTLELVLKAQKAALAIMRPGVLCSDVYAAARKVFADAGVAEAFTHGLGHGIGLQTHEAPSLGPRYKKPLLKGMTVTVEPGLYYPQWGGARWEHTVLIEKDGAVIL